MKNLDDAGLWWESRHAELQDFEVPEPAPDSFLDVSSCDPDQELSAMDDITARDVRNQLNLSKLKRPTAQIIVSLIDTLFPVILALIVKGVDKGSVKLDDDERETLTEAWAEFLKDRSFELSPGYVLIASMLTVYGAKMMVSLSDKKQSSSEIKELQDKYELLEQQFQQVIENKENAA